MRGAVVVMMMAVAPAAGGLARQSAGRAPAPPSRAVLRLRGGAAGGGGLFTVARAGAGSQRMRHSGAGEQALGVLVPLVTVALKKALGVALGVVLLGFDRDALAARIDSPEAAPAAEYAANDSSALARAPERPVWRPPAIKLEFFKFFSDADFPDISQVLMPSPHARRRWA